MIVCNRCKKDLGDFPICLSLIGISKETDFVGCCKGENVCKICGNKISKKEIKK